MKNVIIILVVAIVGSISFVGFNNKKIDSQIQSGELKILLEKNINYTGMPGPNDESYWGKSTFICNDGSVYLFEYDEYDDIDYPYESDLKKLTKELISNSKKIDKTLSESEIKKLQDSIENIINGNEEILLKEKENKIEILQPADATSKESLNIFSYDKNEKINIADYISPSIEEIIEITKKYF